MDMNTQEGRKALQDAVTDSWKSRAARQGMNPKSLGYKKAEIEYASGAMAAINAMYPHPTDPAALSPAVPPIWVINAMSGRPVFE